MGGRDFGNLTRVNGLVYFGLSPFEQRAFKGYVKNGIPNLMRRGRTQFFYTVPAFTLGTYLIYWMKKKNLELSKKNPADFANDV